MAKSAAVAKSAVGSFPAGLSLWFGGRGSEPVVRGTGSLRPWFGGRGLCASTGGTGGFQAHLLPCAPGSRVWKVVA